MPNKQKQNDGWDGITHQIRGHVSENDLANFTYELAIHSQPSLKENENLKRVRQERFVILKSRRDDRSVFPAGKTIYSTSKVPKLQFSAGLYLEPIPKNTKGARLYGSKKAGAVVAVAMPTNTWWFFRWTLFGRIDTFVKAELRQGQWYVQIQHNTNAKLPECVQKLMKKVSDAMEITIY